MSVVVKAKIKELAKVGEKSLNVSTDFAPKLADKVEGMIKEACERARANGRNTVMAKDL
jgi:histone H3/H4